MKENRKGAHPTARLTAHLVWATKYRYHVWQGDIKVRCRQLLMQICDAEDVRIFSGVVSKDHIRCAHRISASIGFGGFGQTLERTLVAHHTARVPATAEAILGATLLGNRLWRVEYRQNHG